MFKRVETFGRVQLRKCPLKRGEGYQMQIHADRSVLRYTDVHANVSVGVRPLKEATAMLNSA